MARTTLTTAAALVLATTAAHAQIQVVYEQPPATSEGGISGGYYSDLSHDTYLYDSFALESATILDEVRFWGFGVMYEAEVRVSIYQHDGSELLGPVLATRTIPANQVGVQITEGWVESGHFWWFEELASIPMDPPVRLEAGREYWIGITGDIELIWSFKALDGDLNILYSNAAQNAFWDQNDTDMAFALLGRPASPADLAEPYASLDFNDVVAFLGAFASSDAAADLAEPIGSLDFADVLAFLQAFAAGV